MEETFHITTSPGTSCSAYWVERGLWQQLNTDPVCSHRSWPAASFIQPFWEMASAVQGRGEMWDICSGICSQLKSESVSVPDKLTGQAFFSRLVGSSVLQVERHQTDFAGRERSEGSWWALLLCLIRTKFLCMEKIN